LGTTDAKFGDFGYLSQQHSSRRVSKYIYRKRGRCDRRPISQKVQHQRECENYSSIFTTRDGRVVGVIYIAGIAVSATTAEYSVATAGDSVEDVAERLERTEMDIGTNTKSDETREYNSDRGGTEDSVVPRMRDRHQSPIFTGVIRISME
jgi:hypothetical protein